MWHRIENKVWCANLLKCGKTGKLIEDDKVRDNQQKDGSGGGVGLFSPFQPQTRLGRGRLYFAAAGKVTCHLCMLLS